MASLQSILPAAPAAAAALVLALVIALGHWLGSLKVAGIRLGIAGVLFSGLLFGHFKVHADERILEFAREFGLILFVYTIGMQVGPAFFASLKREGLRLNLVAAAIVLGGSAIAVLFARFTPIPFPVVMGMLAGATTNTPSLAAAQQALQTVPGFSSEALSLPGLGYAVCYPFGIVGIIFSMMLVRKIFRISPQEEAQDYLARHSKSRAEVATMSIRIDNPNFNGLTVCEIPLLAEGDLVISRILHENSVEVASPSSLLHQKDVVLAVGKKEKLEALKLMLGSAVTLDWRKSDETITAKWVRVTRHEIAGKRLEDLDCFLYGVAVTRISRSEIEFPANPEIEINYADALLVVGNAQAIETFAAICGNSLKELDHPQLIPVFLGIALGVLLGSFPFPVPGMPSPLKLGLAGGPLIVALLLSRAGRIGKLIWYMPASANLMLREVGISLFLACVGLKSGDAFVDILVHGNGFLWFLAGTLITFAPLFLGGLIARLFLRMNYLSICGLLAGSMTDPPALAFANQITPSSAQVVSYAAIYPLVMILRVLIAQVLVVFLAR